MVRMLLPLPYNFMSFSALQEMLDPTVGEGVVTAMRKEVHRMELRHAELLRVQERLMQVCTGASTRLCMGPCTAYRTRSDTGKCCAKRKSVEQCCHIMHRLKVCHLQQTMCVLLLHKTRHLHS